MSNYLKTGAYEKMSSFEALSKANKKCRLGKRYKKDVMDFQCEMNFNLYELHHNLKEGTYKIKNYMIFDVFEPKKREIKCLYYKDRVVQRSLCDTVLKPFLKPKLIYDNCACQEGKGTHFGLNRVCSFMKNSTKKV